MTMPELCAACLTELPAGYPYDHVAIDLALTGRRDLFKAMTAGERREVVLTGLARGLTLNIITTRLNWTYGRIQELLPADHPLSVTRQQPDLEQAIRELWAADLKDIEISLRIGQHVSVVGKVRKRLCLPAKFGPGGRRLAAHRATQTETEVSA
jgi:hypothetical protein